MRDSASSARNASSGSPGQGDESVRIDQRPAVDLGVIAARAEDEVGIEADHRIAAALRPALDRFEQEHVGCPAARELEIGRNGRLEIGDQRRDRDLGFAGDISAREGFVIGQGAHRRLAALGGLQDVLVDGDAKRLA